MRWTPLAAALATLALGVADAGAQTIQNRWVPNNLVTSVATMNGVTYLSGSFTRLGPPTGCFLALDATSGAILANPQVTGFVQVEVPDGSGGRYIGGFFDYVQGQPHSCVAHLDASGNVTSWSPGPIDGPITAMAIDPSSPGVLYIAGLFSLINGASHASLAALDATTGAVTSWAPGVAGGISGIVAQGGIVYLCGSFQTVQGQPRNRLAAVDGAGALLAWDPNVDGAVYTMVPFFAPVTHALTLYVGGEFTNVGGQARYSIAAISAVTGAPTAWSPNADHAVKSILLALTDRGFISSVFAAGTFDEIGAQPRSYLAQLDPSSGGATAWNPALDGEVRAMLIWGNTLVVGGLFHHIGATVRSGLAAIDLSSSAATTWDPNPNSIVNTLDYGSGGVEAGGAFTSLGGVTRHYLAAIDPATGQPTAWDPSPDGPVWALLACRDTLYAGGQFAQLAGQPRHGAAAFNAAGSLTPWDPNVNGPVYALAKLDSVVYLGGGFVTVGGHPQMNLAQVDAATGALGLTLPEVDNEVLAFAQSGNLLYIGGLFRNVAGLFRAGAAAIIGNTVTNWNPPLSSYTASAAQVSSIVVEGNAVLLAGNFAITFGNYHQGIAEVDNTMGFPTSWAISTNGYGTSLLQIGSTVFFGGDFTAVNGTTTGGLCTLNPSTHALTALVTQVGPGVNAMAWNGNALETGGFFTWAGGQPHGDYVALGNAFAAVGDGSVTGTQGALHLSVNPSRGPVTLEFALPAPGPVELELYDLSGRRVRSERWAAMPAGTQHVTWDGAGDNGRPATAGVYLARVRAGGVERAAKVTRLR